MGERISQLAFGLSIKQQEVSGTGEGIVSPGQGLGSFLEEVGLEQDLQ